MRPASFSLEKNSMASERNEHQPFFDGKNWIWLKPNISTHECPHADIGACINCRFPSEPPAYPLTTHRAYRDGRAS